MLATKELNNFMMAVNAMDKKLTKELSQSGPNNPDGSDKKLDKSGIALYTVSKRLEKVSTKYSVAEQVLTKNMEINRNTGNSVVAVYCFMV